MTANPRWSASQRLLACLLCTGDADAPPPAEPVTYRELFRFATKGDVWRVVLASILAILCGASQPVVTVLSGKVVNKLIVTKELEGNSEFLHDVYRIVAIYGALCVFGFFASIVQFYLYSNVCSRVVARIRAEFIRAVLSKDGEWLDSHDSASLLSTLQENLTKIEDGLGDKIGLLLRGIADFVAALTICFVVDWKMASVVVIMGPLGALTLSLMARAMKRPTARQTELAGEAGALAEEAIVNVKTVAACNGQDTMVKRYEAALRRARKATIPVYFINGFFTGLMFCELDVIFGIGFMYGAIAYSRGWITEPGNVLIVMSAMIFGSFFLGLLGPHLMTMLKARVAAGVIYEFVDTKPKIEKKALPGTEIRSAKGHLIFDDVHFRYASRDMKVLQGLNISAEPGETIALVGQSGCGKSTAIGLITRLYDPDSGSVSLDGVDLKEIDPQTLRKLIGVVQQEPCLFTGTIRENICLGESLSEQDIVEAAKTANAHDFIMKMDKGYDTLVGAGGVSLSGGQKQRVAIARAIARKPRLLLLDEATSALDSESERVVQAALEEAAKGRTTLVIAHRLSTIRSVKKIHVIHQGRVVEMGSHEELVAVGGMYAGLVKKQALEGSIETSQARERAISSRFKPKQMKSFQTKLHDKSKVSRGMEGSY